jgi:hypothetical protein
MKRLVVLQLVLALAAVACGSDGGSGAGDAVSTTAVSTTAVSTTAIPTAAVQARLDEIAGHVTSWQHAETIEEATAEAEAAANLVVGPGGPGYGDRNGDGTIDGATDQGLLPSLDGSSSGIVLDSLGDAECVRRDVLGGSWDDPQQRWAELDTVLASWTPSNNTMPQLAAHPMRIVGWVTLTQTATLDQAQEYGGHAQLHVDVSERALGGC